MFSQFISHFQHYLVEVIPALAIGFLLSGIIYEFVPCDIVERYLGKKGIKPIMYATVIGTILPLCCMGSLPVALTFYIKGASLGPVLAFLVATPATSISALLVTWKLLGLKFTVYIFFSVIIMGVIMGIIGNMLKAKITNDKLNICPHCMSEKEENHTCEEKNTANKIKHALKFAFIEMPKEIGIETLIGLVLAALVVSITPVGLLIKNYLSGNLGYIFSLVFGLIMYLCSTASVPLVHAFISQGMQIGAGLVLLLVGPITSYGAILVIKKEFGIKVLVIYLFTISILSLILGVVFNYI